MTHDEMIAVIQAHKYGKVIQSYDNYMGMWIDLPYPYWNFSACEYRVKPDPKPDMIRYARADVAWDTPQRPGDNLRLTFDGETGRLKAAEVM